MDGLVAAGVVISLLLALGLAILFLVASSRRARRRRQATSRIISVAELLERAAKHGEPVRLNWANADLDAYGRVRPQARDQFPTGILPKLPKQTNHERT